MSSLAQPPVVTIIIMCVSVVMSFASSFINSRFMPKEHRQKLRDLQKKISILIISIKVPLTLLLSVHYPFFLSFSKPCFMAVVKAVATSFALFAVGDSGSSSMDF